MARFKLLVGSHSQDVEVDGKIVTHSYKVENNKCPIIDSDTDLCKRFNTPGFPGKFEQVPDNVKPSKPVVVTGGDAAPKAPKARPFSAPQGYELEEKNETAPKADKESEEEEGGTGEDTYDSMTVAQLREHAAEEEIPLHGATTKADIIKALRSHG